MNERVTLIEFDSLEQAIKARENGPTNGRAQCASEVLDRNSYSQDAAGKPGSPSPPPLCYSAGATTSSDRLIRNTSNEAKRQASPLVTNARK